MRQEVNETDRQIDRQLDAADSATQEEDRSL